MGAYIQVVRLALAFQLDDSRAVRVQEIQKKSQFDFVGIYLKSPREYFRLQDSALPEWESEAEVTISDIRQRNCVIKGPF